TVEDARVADEVALPDGTRGASVAVRRADTAPTPDGSAEASPTPTTTPGEGDALAADGAPAHVVTVTDAGNGLALVDRAAPDDPVATWSMPGGVDAEMAPVVVVVHPDGTATDLELVTRWSIGESDVLARTVIRDGTVEVNQVLRDELQPANSGGAAEIADSEPVFSPGGDWLAWVETPEGADGPPRVGLLGWDAGGPTGDEATIAAPDDLR